MAVKEVGTNGAVTADGKERQRKAPEPILVNATHDAKAMLQVGASIPGDVYDKLVTLAAGRDGAIDGQQLIRSFLNSEVQRGIFEHVGADFDTWYTAYTEHRKATRQSAGAAGGSTRAATNVFANLLDDDDGLERAIAVRNSVRAEHPDWSKEQVAAEMAKLLKPNNES